MSNSPALWLVLFYDDAAMLDVRKQYAQDHIEYLEAHQDVIKLAGGMRYSEEAPFIWGAWVVTALNRDEIEKLVENDPYFSPDHRRYEVNYWGLALETMKQKVAA